MSTQTNILAAAIPLNIKHNSSEDSDQTRLTLMLFSVLAGCAQMIVVYLSYGGSKDSDFYDVIGLVVVKTNSDESAHRYKVISWSRLTYKTYRCWTHVFLHTQHEFISA